MEESKQWTLARLTIKGTAWTYASYYSGKIMVFLSTVILARLLTQEEYGVAGYAIIVIASLDVLSDLGIGPALIFHRDDPEAANTAFWLGLGISLVLLAATWLSAPLVAAFFQDPRATPVIRVLALTFPLSALSNVHNILLQKELRFGRTFLPDFARMLSKGLLSIFFALLGFGPWSLIFGQVGGTAISVGAYWKARPWRPSLRLDLGHARALLGYGAPLVLVDLLGALLQNVDYLLIGRFLGAASLGIYTVAFRIPDLLIMQFCNIVATVIFPVYARLRDEEPEALREAFLATTRYVPMLTVPAGLGLMLVARPFILVVFGARWEPAIPVLQAIALYALLNSLTYHAGDVYKATGRTDLLTKLALVRSFLLVPALWWVVTQVGTLQAVGWVHVVVALVNGALSLLLAARILRLPVAVVLRALLPAMVAGAALVATVHLTLLLTVGLSDLFQLLAATLVGAASYGLLLWLIQRDVMIGAGHTLRAALVRR